MSPITTLNKYGGHNKLKLINLNFQRNKKETVKGTPIIQIRTVINQMAKTYKIK